MRARGQWCLCLRAAATRTARRIRATWPPRLTNRQRRRGLGRLARRPHAILTRVELPSACSGQRAVLGAAALQALTLRPALARLPHVERHGAPFSARYL